MSLVPPRKVIFDTDPGVDDAMALYFALAHPGIDVVGVTTTFGNVSVQQAARNALYLMGLANRSLPVTQGVAAPMAKPPEAPPETIHGRDGLGNLPTRLPGTQVVDPRGCAQFIVDTARAQPGDTTLVAVGPLGNLAQALELEPGLPALVREVIIMGGTMLEPGNVSPVAEANIWNDPHAADRVFSAGWKLTMVGLDVTHRVITPLSLFKRIADHHRHIATDTLHHAVEFYAGFYTARHPHVMASPGCFAHDVLAFACLVCPELFTVQSGGVRVTTAGVTQGQTMWGKDQPLTHVCMQVDAPACLALIEATLMGDWLQH